MIKLITQLWNGDLNPVSNLGKNNSQIKQLEFLIERNREKIENSICKNQRQLFEKYNDGLIEYMGLVSEQAFYDGFCLGTKLSAEALTDTTQLL